MNIRYLFGIKSFSKRGKNKKKKDYIFISAYKLCKIQTILREQWLILGGLASSLIVSMVIGHINSLFVYRYRVYIVFNFIGI